MERAVKARIWLSALLAGVVLPPAGNTWAAVGDLQLASRATGLTGVKGDGDSFEPRLSADGRFVVFATTATTLDPADADAAVPDIYVRDLQAGVTTLVSRADGPDGAKGDGASDAPAISADGRYVAFVSEAANLDSAKTDASMTGVFVRDLREHTTTLVSRVSDGGTANAGAAAPAISADGRVVAFESDATNLASGDTDELTDVFAHDVTAGTTVLVSGPGADPRTGTSTQPAISADGTTVAFSSTVTALVEEDGDPPDAPLSDVFARNLTTGALTLVSRSDGADGEKGNAASDSPAFSGDGRIVGFSSAAANLDPGDLDNVSDIFVRDLTRHTTAIVSLSDGPTGGKGDGDSTAPALSQTGRFVAFASLSALDPADGDALGDVYSRDVVTGRTRLLSRAAGVLGAKGDGASDSPSTSADARFASYASAATNIHSEDADAFTDIFVRDVLGTLVPLAPSPPRPSASVQMPGRFPVAPASCPVDGTLMVLTNAADRRSGGPGSDILVGGGGPDVLRGLGGRDCLYGERGADRLLGGAGDDLLSGGAGTDRLTDTRGSDRLSGGAGNDVIDARDTSRRDRRRRDRVSCGSGSRDRALVDAPDIVARDCEHVIQRKARTPHEANAR